MKDFYTIWRCREGQGHRFSGKRGAPWVVAFLLLIGWGWFSMPGVYAQNQCPCNAGTEASLQPSTTDEKGWRAAGTTARAPRTLQKSASGSEDGSLVSTTDRGGFGLVGKRCEENAGVFRLAGSALEFADAITAESTDRFVAGGSMQITYHYAANHMLEVGLYQLNGDDYHVINSWIISTDSCGIYREQIAIPGNTTGEYAIAAIPIDPTLSFHDPTGAANIPYFYRKFTLSGQAASASSARLVIVNEGPGEVCYVYVSPSTATAWGDDLLGSSTLLAGEQYSIDLASGQYDLRAEDCDHTVVDEATGVMLTGNQRWTLHTAAGGAATGLRTQTLSRVAASRVGNNYPEQAEGLVDALLAHLGKFDAITPAQMEAALNRGDVGDRINGLVQEVWGAWAHEASQRKIDVLAVDPATYGLSPFRQLVIQLIQGRQLQLSDAHQHALHNFFTRSEDASAWSTNMKGVVGAINRESFQWQ